MGNCLQGHIFRRTRCSIGRPSLYCKYPADLNALAKKTPKQNPKPLGLLLTAHSLFLFYHVHLCNCLLKTQRRPRAERSGMQLLEIHIKST